MTTSGFRTKASPPGRTMAMTQPPLVIAAVETAEVTLEANPELAVHGARGSHTTSSFTFIRVTAESGVSGYGEVSATPRWSGEDAVTARHFIRDLVRPLLVGRPVASVPAITLLVDQTFAGNPFTKAGINMALWDLVGRATGRRVVELLGGPYRDRVPVKMSLSGDGETLERCYDAIHRRGFRSFKVKVGIKVDGDLARFRLARELAGPEVFLGADANGGWSRMDAAQAIPRLADMGCRFIEQPVVADDVDGLASLRRYGLPVLADESVFSLGDLARVIRSDAADAVSVYVGKVGALEDAVAALKMLALFGVDGLIGSNGEMGLGAAAQVHVACASPQLSGIPSDIIGHHYYDRETLAQPVDIDGLFAHLPSSAGLGVEPMDEIEREFA
jgi:L-alanine-DL-glutamate epimerase-like enolase superfamily enzyme